MSISPETLNATLRPGESISEKKSVTIDTLPPQADVVFSFDTTGSMGNIIKTAKEKALEIMAELNTHGVDIQYAVVSHKDYPGEYSSYGYNNIYGGLDDYPYQLEQTMTSNATDIQNAINGLGASGGADGPESYTRVLYESYADPGLGWRPGAKKIYVHFGDNVPHDNNLNEGLHPDAGIWSTGGDPGRNGIILDYDDLDLQTVLNEMADNNITLLECRSDSYALDYWEYWSAITGGSTFIVTTDDFVNQLTNEILAALTSPTIDNLHLITSAGYEPWLISVTPDSYSGPTGVTVEFDIVIKVPIGTVPSNYSFTITAIDSKGTNYGTQTVNISIVSLPPDVSNAYASPDCLWPPNNKFVDVEILGVTDPQGLPITIEILSITSDEATSTTPGAGGPRMAPDADPNCIGASIAKIRAERSGLRDGRVYQINFRAINFNGAFTEGYVKVKVPHSANNNCNAIDSGQDYDATKIN